MPMQISASRSMCKELPAEPPTGVRWRATRSGRAALSQKTLLSTPEGEARYGHKWCHSDNDYTEHLLHNYFLEL